MELVNELCPNINKPFMGATIYKCVSCNNYTTTGLTNHRGSYKKYPINEEGEERREEGGGGEEGGRGEEEGSNNMAENKTAHC